MEALLFIGCVGILCVIFYLIGKSDGETKGYDEGLGIGRENGRVAGFEEGKNYVISKKAFAWMADGQKIAWTGFSGDRLRINVYVPDEVEINMAKKIKVKKR